jgi:hypothetical protein
MNGGSAWASPEVCEPWLAPDLALQEALHAKLQPAPALEGASKPTFDLPFDLPLVLPELRVRPTPVQLFMFSAITWNRHHIHYNPECARTEGHADVVVQRSLIGNFFARHAAAWLGDSGGLARLSWRVTGPALAHQELCCHGVVRERLDGRLAPAELAPSSVPLRYLGWLTAEGGREVAVAQGVLCIHASS